MALDENCGGKPFQKAGRSVGQTGRTMKQIAWRETRKWQSHRVDEKDSFKASIARAAKAHRLKKKPK